MLRRSCARCSRQLSKPRHEARKRYCARCDVAVRHEREERAHDAYVSRVYGIPLGSYRHLYVYQGGVCYICRRANGRTKRLAVDHDHKTGLVRGLLCKPCNRMLGHARDNPLMFARAYGYLMNPPARKVIYEAAVTATPSDDERTGDIQQSRFAA